MFVSGIPINKIKQFIIVCQCSEFQSMLTKKYMYSIVIYLKHNTESFKGCRHLQCLLLICLSWNVNILDDIFSIIKQLLHIWTLQEHNVYLAICFRNKKHGQQNILEITVILTSYISVRLTKKMSILCTITIKMEYSKIYLNPFKGFCTNST